MRGENIRAETERAEAGFGFRKFNRIGVEPEQFSSRLKAFENFLCVSAVAERAVSGNFAGLGLEHSQNFRDHDGPMRAGGSFAGREDFADSFGVTLWVVLLVFLLEAARIP